MASGTYQGSVLAPVLFGFTNDLEEGVKCTVRMGAEDTKLGVVPDTPKAVPAPSEIWTVWSWAE